MEWSSLARDRDYDGSLAREGKIFSWVEEKSCPRHHGLSAARSTASEFRENSLLSSLSIVW